MGGKPTGPVGFRGAGDQSQWPEWRRWCLRVPSEARGESELDPFGGANRTGGRGGVQISDLEAETS
jgi:hypothetical protein